MPIYEYECDNCHHQFDLMQKINEKPEKQCPKCLMNTAKRLVSAAGFQLKGTGWYVTDFKDKGTKKEHQGASKNGNSTDSDKKTKPQSKGESD